MKLTALTSKRALAVNAASNTLGLLAQLALSFFMAPIVLRALGDARNGVWTFVESFLAYLMLFDLGIAASLVRFVPRHVATGDRDGLNRVFSACLVFLLAIANFAASLPLSVFPAILDGLGALTLKSVTRTTFLVLRVPALLAV